MAVVANRVYVFGGVGSTQENLDDLHVLDVEAGLWTDLTPISRGPEWPLPTALMGIASVGDLIYVFGGRQVNDSNALHVFSASNSTWASLSEVAGGDAPAPRSGLAMAAVDHILYVFGGQSAREVADGFELTTLGDLHRFDTHARTWMAPVEKPETTARTSFAMTAVGTTLYAFGGNDASGRLGDLQQMASDTTLWTALNGSVAGDKPDAKATMGMAVVESVLYVFGGVVGAAPSIDLHAFDAQSLRWRNLTDAASGDAPSARSGMGMAAVASSLYVFGGLTLSGFVNDVYLLETTGMIWSNLTGGVNGLPPSPRDAFGIATVGSSIYVFGGYDDALALLLNDLHVFDTVTHKWTAVNHTIGNPPPAKASFGIAAVRDKLYVFGGVALSGGVLTPSNGLHIYNTLSGEWVDATFSHSGTAPKPRQFMSVLAVRDLVYVLGGVDATGFLNDFHMLDTTTSHWTDLTALVGGEGPRVGHSRGIAVLDGMMCVFGGYAVSEEVEGEQVVIADLHVLRLPRTTVFRSFSPLNFATIFDWDVVQLAASG
eukprot:266432-Rhodomonas_salina.1